MEQSKDENTFIKDKIIDGVAIANVINDITRAKVEKLKEQYGIIPKFVVIMVGNNPASQKYVNNKQKKAVELGIECIVDRCPDNISQADLQHIVNRYNIDISVHGIMVQLPLPQHINATEIISTICDTKDIDGLHPINMGKLYTGEDVSGRIPCTAVGVMEMLSMCNIDVSGKNVLIIGRSDIVGKPLGRLMMDSNATVTQAHSKTYTSKLIRHMNMADIIITAVGQPGLIYYSQLEYAEPNGKIIIDVGTTVDEASGKLKGDVEITPKLMEKVQCISPVPGGVGPLTIAMLMHNVVAIIDSVVLKKL